MSLKTFHIVFLIVCLLLFGGFGVWCFAQHGDTGNDLYTLAGAASFMCGGALLYYGIVFLKKYKDWGFM